MNRIGLAQIFIGTIGLIMAVITFCLMRFPQFRRKQFQEYGAFSLKDSLLGGLTMLILMILMIFLQ